MSAQRAGSLAAPSPNAPRRPRRASPPESATGRGAARAQPLDEEQPGPPRPAEHRSARSRSTPPARALVHAKARPILGSNTGTTRRVRLLDLRPTCAHRLVMGTFGPAWSLTEAQTLHPHRASAVIERYPCASPDRLHRAAAATAVGHVVTNAPTKPMDTRALASPPEDAIGEGNCSGAGYRIRTGDSELGKLVLYQLS